MLTDSHNHTCHFSSDAEMSISELISGCSQRGISRIAITEHYDYDYPHIEEPVQTFDINQFVQAFEVWKKLSSSSLDLSMGIELGYQSHIASIIDEVSLSAPFDSVILSNHLIDGKDVYFYPECYKIYSKEELHRKYIAILAEMAEKCSAYNIIGHYDYINRYCKKRNCYVLYSDCPKEFDALFETIISKGKSLEINTRSIHKLKQKKAKCVMPDSELLMRYKDMGGKMITLGSDSHTTSTLGIHFEETAEYLKSLGFKSNIYFKNRMPHEEAL